LDLLTKKKELQIYCIGDLDDFYWPKTIWYGLIENGKLQSIALLYFGSEIPSLLSFCDDNGDYSQKLLKYIRPSLPDKFFAHLSTSLSNIFKEQKIIEDFGLHYKMALKKAPFDITDGNIRRLSIIDLPIIREFYSIAYPNNWFDNKMLETQKYFGYFLNNSLVGISGVHVYSNVYKVAALGNIATHPDYRGQQIGFKLTSKLCCDLIRDVDCIGLNVNADNDYAIKCYRKTGFEIIGSYEEFLVQNTLT
jgi:ribosomal protein S18 acetylase RimI-like enzyme